ncbi:hypothetical protein V8G54_034882 [Vigna mungo]|uniref:DUF8039 domain-containing protein n=1 Tax=Vigna mungo TaxID=3915 RepID=A0AAQ3RDT3_VIGMU
MANEVKLTIPGWQAPKLLLGRGVEKNSAFPLFIGNIIIGRGSGRMIQKEDLQNSMLSCYEDWLISIISFPWSNRWYIESRFRRIKSEVLERTPFLLVGFHLHAVRIHIFYQKKEQREGLFDGPELPSEHYFASQKPSQFSCLLLYVERLKYNLLLATVRNPSPSLVGIQSGMRQNGKTSGVNAMVSLPLAPIQLAIFPSLSMSLTQIALGTLNPNKIKGHSLLITWLWLIHIIAHGGNSPWDGEKKNKIRENKLIMTFHEPIYGLAHPPDLLVVWATCTVLEFGYINAMLAVAVGGVGALVGEGKISKNTDCVHISEEYQDSKVCWVSTHYVGVPHCLCCLQDEIDTDIAIEEKVFKRGKVASSPTSVSLSIPKHDLKTLGDERLCNAQQYLLDILAATIGRLEHPGRVRAVGPGVRIRDYFGSSIRHSSYAYNEEQRERLTQEITKRAELYSVFSSMFQQQFETYGMRPVPSPVQEQEHVVPPTGRSGKGSCSAPAAPGDDMDDASPCLLYILDDTETVLVARGTMFKAMTVVHGMQLSEDAVKVSVDEIIVPDAEAPLATSCYVYTRELCLWFCSLHRPPPTHLRQAVDL